MFKLDDNLLRELGLGDLPAAEKNRMLQHIYETLEMRVGMTLAQQMSEAQLSEFETFIDSNDEAGALKWLETNFPNYKQVVADELEKLKTEIKAAAPQIVAASQQQPAMPVAPQPGMQPTQPAPQMPSQPMPQQPPMQQPMPTQPMPGQPGVDPQAPQTPPAYDDQQPPAAQQPAA